MKNVNFQRQLWPVSWQLVRMAGSLASLLVACLLTAAAWGQTTSAPAIAQALARHDQRVPTEKLFLHLDRPSYVSGETLWLKIYAVEEASHRPLAASTVAYVELLDTDNRPVQQVKIALLQARGKGSLVLPASLPSGRYTLRAYTNWMKNFGPETYFHAPVTVVNTRQPLPAPTASGTALAYDAQFFPEGGYLVRGLRSKVGFKITDNQGRSVVAEGRVLDAAGQVMAQFSTLRFGMGNFNFTPTQVGAAYTAVVQVRGQHPLTVRLPVVRERGYVLSVEEMDATQLRLTVQAPGEAADKLLLLAHSRQRPATLAAELQLSSGSAVVTIDRRKLPAGISHFTLFTPQGQPLCERLYFKPPPPELVLTAKTDKRQYAPRDKVELQLTATNPAGQPLSADMSVAVYQIDSLSANGGADIASYLWLSSELKGTIENPASYCTTTGPDAAQAADNLMLTQGWSRFRWRGLLAGQPDSLPHLPELNGHLVRGQLTNRLTGAPQAGVPAFLTAPSRKVQLYVAVSQVDGSVQFETANLFGTRQLVLQTDYRRDSLHQLELLSPFSTQYLAKPPAAFDLSERLAASLRQRHLQAEVQRRYFGTMPPAYQLPRAADSAAFYGRADERYRLDDYTRFKVMEEVMREYVHSVMVRARKDGFHFLVPDQNAHTLSENPLVLLDGMPVFDINKIMAFDPLKVRQLDVLTSRYFLGPLLYDGIVSYATYTGDLAGFPLDAHALLQEYEGLQGEREFYAPRYDTPAQKQSRLPDFRNLLYWNPMADARASLSFYTSDQAGTYRVVVQGLSESGLSGSTSYTFTVNALP